MEAVLEPQPRECFSQAQGLWLPSPQRAPQIVSKDKVIGIDVASDLFLNFLNFLNIDVF